ncbi:MAG: radical SAM protein [Deltaproteobacteria bacterium]|nr:radical SAM protein [Candidatus Tharpella sp.]
MLLIYPPVAKSSEAPAGIAKLAGALRGHGVSCTAADLNLEGLHFLLGELWSADDTWSRRALRHVDKNLAALGEPSLYQNFDRYKRAVADINRVLEVAGRKTGVSLSLANYQDPLLSPLKSQDLLASAAWPQENIYYPFFSKRLISLIKFSNPFLIGFSLNYLSQALVTFAMIGFCRQRYPELPVVVGGGLVTSWLSRPGAEKSGWRNLFAGLIDHLVAGPGESVLLELLRAKGVQKRLPQIVDREFAPPDFSDFSELNHLAPNRILPYAASSGCYWNRCSFCPEKAEGNCYRPLASQIVISELDQLVRTTRPGLIHFLDNALSPALMRALINQPSGVPWYGLVRFSDDLCDLEFCRKLRQAGCLMLKLGIESGDPQVLQAMGKGISLKQVATVLRNLQEVGIATYVYLLFGTPTEALPEARRTLDFIVKHCQAVTFLNLAIFNLPLYSPESRELEVRDFYSGDLSLYGDFVHPLGWQRREIRRFLDHEFKRHSALAPIIKRDPPSFTSNHAAFFLNSF